MARSMTLENGFLLVNKPEGITSHDVVDRLREVTGIKKIGHAGTLDPFAAGLLILAVGREATKRIDKMVKLDKKYKAEIQLGAESDTHDKNGNIIETTFEYYPSLQEAKRTLSRFVGEVEQIPPMHSAKKVKGRKLYELARRGVEIERESIRVNIYDIDPLSYKDQVLTISVYCSSGTYIRTLAYDIGRSLGTGGYLRNLHRSAIGEYTSDQATELDHITASNWRELLFSPE